MTNQITRLYAARPEEQVVASIAEHIPLFWEPRMRSQIVAYLTTGGEGLYLTARAAVMRIDGEMTASAGH